MPAPFEFDRTWTFEVGAGELWDTLRRTDLYTDWWDWLRSCDVETLAVGEVASCVVRAPLPYALHFEIHIDRVEPAELVATTVHGDLSGPARLEIVADGPRCRARLAWSLQLQDSVLRRLALVARPAMVWAHDRVVDVGMREFRERALVQTR